MEYSDALMQLRLLPEALEHAREAVAHPGHTWRRADGGRGQTERGLAGAAVESTGRGRGGCRSGESEFPPSAPCLGDRVGHVGRPGGPAAPRCDNASATSRRARRSALALERAGMQAYAVDATSSPVGWRSLRDGWPTPCSSGRDRATLSRGLPLLAPPQGHARGSALRAATRPPRPHAVTEPVRTRRPGASIEPRSPPPSCGPWHPGTARSSAGSGSPPGSATSRRHAYWNGWSAPARPPSRSSMPNRRADIGDDLGELRAVYAELVAARQETGAEPAGLRARQARIEQRIRSATWSTHAQGAHAGALSSAPELRRALGGRVLVEFDILDGELVAAVLGPRQTQIVRVGKFEDVQHDAESLLFFLRYVTSTRAPAMAVNAALANARETIDRLARNLIHPLGLAAGCRAGHRVGERAAIDSVGRAAHSSGGIGSVGLDVGAEQASSTAADRPNRPGRRARAARRPAGDRASR